MEELEMDLPRKLGILIIMIIPGFVIGGALWNLTHSWIAVLVWEILLAIGYGYFLAGRKPSGGKA
jgi:ABC-type transport system involved in cytochrome c biogenesis permease subunit